MKYNAEYEQYLNKKDYMFFRSELKTIKKNNGRYLSRRRAKFYRSFEMAKEILVLIIPLLFYTSLLAVTIVLYKNNWGEFLQSVPHVVYETIFSLSTTLLITVVISNIVIGFRNNTEYFDENEFKIFLKLKVFNNQPIWLLLVMNVLYFALLIVSFFTNSFSSIIINSAYSSVYSIAIIIKFILFIRKNSIEKYFVYLDSSHSIPKMHRSAALERNIAFIELVKNRKITAQELLSKIAIYDINYYTNFVSLLIKLRDKYLLDESVIKEQNIIETYITAFSSTNPSITQLMNTSILVSLYDKYFLSTIGISDKRKNINSTIEKILMSLDSFYNNEIQKIGMNKIKINIKPSCCLYLDDFKSFYNSEIDIILLQSCISLSIEAFLKTIESISVDHDRQQNKVMKKYNEIGEKIAVYSNQNWETLDTFSNQVSAFVSELTSKIAIKDDK